MVYNERVELVVVAGGTTAAAADGVERGHRADLRRATRHRHAPPRWTIECCWKRCLPALAVAAPITRMSRCCAAKPPLHADAGVQLVTFTARQSFHPERLHAALDVQIGYAGPEQRTWPRCAGMTGGVTGPRSS